MDKTKKYDFKRIGRGGKGLQATIEGEQYSLIIHPHTQHNQQGIEVILSDISSSKQLVGYEGRFRNKDLIGLTLGHPSYSPFDHDFNSSLSLPCNVFLDLNKNERKKVINDYFALVGKFQPVLKFELENLPWIKPQLPNRFYN